MKQILLALAFITLVGCRENALKKVESNNSGVEVELLFENDGCKVYRFWDGNYVYYTDCTGKISYEYTTQSGKSQTTHKVETLNNSRYADSIQ